MALDFNPQERGMFTAPRMPNATWGGLVQGYRQMGSPLEAIGAGLDRSARISNQNKLMDLLGSGKLDLSDPGKAYQQAAPLLNRTTESAVQNFGDLLTRSLQSRQEKRADVAQELAKDQAQWNRENQLAELGFKNLAEERQAKLAPLQEALLGEQIISSRASRNLADRQFQANQAAKLAEAKQPKAYVDKEGNVHYVPKAEALQKGYIPFDVSQQVVKAGRESPSNQAYIQKGIEWATAPEEYKKGIYEKGLAKSNLVEDVNLGDKEMAWLNSVEQALTDEERAQFAALPDDEKVRYLLNKGRFI